MICWSTNATTGTAVNNVKVCDGLRRMNTPKFNAAADVQSTHYSLYVKHRSCVALTMNAGM